MIAGGIRCVEMRGALGRGPGGGLGLACGGL